MNIIAGSGFNLIPGVRVYSLSFFEHLEPAKESVPVCADCMLYYALLFLVVALIAGALGFFALAGIAAWVAKILFIIFVVVFLVSLITRRRPPV